MQPKNGSKEFRIARTARQAEKSPYVKQLKKDIEEGRSELKVPENATPQWWIMKAMHQKKQWKDAVKESMRSTEETEPPKMKKDEHQEYMELSTKLGVENLAKGEERRSHVKEEP